MRWWCLSQCEGEECSGPPCSGLSRHRRSSSICLAAGAWAGQANMDTWCQNNCATGYCPASHCRCQGKSLSVCSSVDQFKKLKKKPIKNRFHQWFCLLQTWIQSPQQPAQQPQLNLQPVQQYRQQRKRQRRQPNKQRRMRTPLLLLHHKMVQSRHLLSHQSTICLKLNLNDAVHSC